MANSNPLTPYQTKKALERFAKATEKSIAKETAAFKKAARQAAETEADQIAERYAAYYKEISALRLKYYEAALRKKGGQQSARAELKAMQDAALKALSKTASESISKVLQKQGFPAAKNPNSGGESDGQDYLVDRAWGRKPKGDTGSMGDRGPGKDKADPPGHDSGDERADDGLDGP